MARQVKLLIEPKDRPTPLPAFTSVRISQELHTHHTFEIKVPFDDLEGRTAGFMQQAHRELVGKPITFSLIPDGAGTGGKFAFTGFVTDLTVASDSDYTGSFLIRGYGPSCLLTDGVQKRTFVNQGLADIVNQVLQPYQVNLVPTTKNLKGQVRLPYVVQYNESNFDFLNRLLAECHEWFFYDGTSLQFGLPDQQEPVPLEMSRSWSSFQLETAIRPTRLGLRSYDPTQNQHLDGRNPAIASGVSNNEFAQFAQQTSNDVFTQPSYATPSWPLQSRPEVEAAATADGAAQAAGSLLFRGRSENPDLRLGVLIDAATQGLGSDNLGVESVGKYRVVSLVHEVDSAGTYTNSFTAVLHSLAQPPANPYAQAQPGLPELAEVIDVADPQQLGRVRVRYYWSVEKPLHAESKWLRVLTPYAGHGKGQLFTPEVGSQVLLNYEQNRAEQPVVLGNLFHAQNQQGAKYTTAENRLKGLQTAGGNKVVMSDTLGAQTILLSNSNNKGTAVEISFAGNGSINIKSSGAVSVHSPKIALEAGSGSISMNAGSISMKATTITAMGMAATVIGGATVNVGAGMLNMAGGLVNMIGAGPVNVKGSLINLNGGGGGSSSSSSGSTPATTGAAGAASNGAAAPAVNGLSSGGLGEVGKLLSSAGKAVTGAFDSLGAEISKAVPSLSGLQGPLGGIVAGVGKEALSKAVMAVVSGKKVIPEALSGAITGTGQAATGLVTGIGSNILGSSGIEKAVVEIGGKLAGSATTAAAQGKDPGQAVTDTAATALGDKSKAAVDALREGSGAAATPTPPATAATTPAKPATPALKSTEDSAKDAGDILGKSLLLNLGLNTASTPAPNSPDSKS